MHENSVVFHNIHEKPYYYFIIIYIEMMKTTRQTSGDNEHTQTSDRFS